jgi:putative DNA primase/helicase
MSSQQFSALDWALIYYRRGWIPLPVLLRSKRPTMKEWQDFRPAEEDLPSHFDGTPQNIGVLLGEPSGGLVDVDIDALEALKIAPEVLPSTGATFGRKSKPESHWLYTASVQKSVKFTDPAAGGDRGGKHATLIELRSTGLQTVLPGSTHESGEAIVWDQQHEPTKVDATELLRLVKVVATLALLARHWPAGDRHDAALALAGGLLRSGLSADTVTDYVRLVAETAGDEQVADRVEAVRTTAEKLRRDGAAVTGWPRLTELMGEPVVRKVREWLNLNADADIRLGRLAFTTLDNVVACPIEWLWRGHFVQGAINIVAGDPGLGKSFLAMDIAARISRGKPWPVGEPDTRDAPCGSVIMLAAEDDPAFTIKPRLAAAGADMTKIACIEGVRLLGEDGVSFFDLSSDICHLDEAMVALPDTKLLIVDPIDSYLGKTDSHVNAQVRGVLAPLQAWAARHNIAVIVVKHLNKGESTNPLYRITGSIAFAACARSVWLVGQDEGDSERRIAAPVKMNLGPMPKAFAFTLSPAQSDPETAVVEWEPEEVDRGANEVLFGKNTSKLSEAVAWLSMTLANADGPIEGNVVKEEAEEEGIAPHTLQRARKQLRVVAAPSGQQGKWHWSLPDQEVGQV